MFKVIFVSTVGKNGAATQVGFEFQAREDAEKAIALYESDKLFKGMFCPNPSIIRLYE